MKITPTPGNEMPVNRIVAMLKSAETAQNALYAALQDFETSVTVYQVTRPDGTIYKVDPPDKGLYPTVLNPARLEVAQAGIYLAAAHELIRLVAVGHGIIETDDGGGGK